MRLIVVSLVTCLLAVGVEPVALGQASSSGPAPSAGVADVPGRFVMPEGGYAVTFPEGWEVQVYPDYHNPVPTVEAREPHDDSAFDDAAYCWVRVGSPCGDGVATSCSTLIDEAAAREVAWLESGTEVPVPSTVESTVLTLPAGYVVRVRTEYADPERDWAYYRMTDGRSLAVLGCAATPGPDDHWLSVAETFEFLPVEQ